MGKTKSFASVGAAFAVGIAVLAGSSLATMPDAAAAEVVEEGKALAFDRRKGNCLACHVAADGDLAGNSGPPLIAMKARFPDKAVLRAQIWDATARNPQTMMPPFGKHRILSEEEIDKVVEFVYSL